MKQLTKVQTILLLFSRLDKVYFPRSIETFSEKVVTKEFDKYNLKGFKYRAHNGYDNYILV